MTSFSKCKSTFEPVRMFISLFLLFLSYLLFTSSFRNKKNKIKTEHYQQFEEFTPSPHSSSTHASFNDHV